jgi:hypothetical protein
VCVEDASGDYEPLTVVAMLSNRSERFSPRVVSAAMMTTETRAAMRPYSMAVAPD